MLEAGEPRVLPPPPPASVGQLAGRPKGPAKPILKGVGLDAPFFDDKNRAFWVLQSIGWGGYFILRSLSGLANSMGAMFIVHTLAADRDRLFADLADGEPVPAADRDARAL